MRWVNGVMSVHLSAFKKTLICIFIELNKTVMANRNFKTDTNNKAKLHHQDTIEREWQLQAAVEFCRQNNCRGLKAIKDGIL